MRIGLIILQLLLSVLAQKASADGVTPTGDVLPGTQPLRLEEPLDELMVRGISEWADAELLKARNNRSAPWLSAGDDARAQARQRLKAMIGMPGDVVAEPKLTLLSTPQDSPIQTEAPWGVHPKFKVSAYRWQTADTISGYGLIAIPSTPGPYPLVVVTPDADQSPELLFGLQAGLHAKYQLAKRFAEQGCVVLCPLLIDRECTWSGHPDVKWTNIPHRELVYRTSFELGLHPIGYEIAKLITGIRALRQQLDTSCTCLIGIGEGGMLSMFAAAIFDDEIDAAAVCGYFNQREEIWQEPIYRNLFGQLREFGDAEIASLIVPRPLIIESGPAPEVDGPPQVEGRLPVAAPGQIRTPKSESAQREFERAREYASRVGAADALQLVTSTEDHAGHDTTINELLKAAHASPDRATHAEMLPYKSANEGTEAHRENRMKEQLDELIRYSQVVMHASASKRDRLWAPLREASPKEFETVQAGFRKMVHDMMIGRLEAPLAEANPRSRKIIDEPTHVGYEVLLDVVNRDDADGSVIVAGGVLLLPRDLRLGERRPVVVCQHGLEGTPESTITTDETTRYWRVYGAFATRLAERGFIVYSPQNPYRGRDRFRVLQRKSNPLGLSLFSYIIEQHRQTLSWLASLPYVDPERIGFYGLSYGGKTAMRVPPLLEATETSPAYCFSICSADFNEWINKNVVSDQEYSYVYKNEYEMWEWNMAHVASYAELAYLVADRPFMVERGHSDVVGIDEWVAWEYARVRRFYALRGLADRTEIEFFDGGHVINGKGTFRFLHRHLDWPEPVASAAK